MPQEPKKRHSRQRQGKRRAHIHLKTASAVLCPNCKQPMLAHRVCKHCGFYKGQSIRKVKSKAVIRKKEK